MNKHNLTSGFRFVATKKIAVGIVVISILGLTALQFQYLAAAAKIENALAVEPQSINFGFVLPQESHEKQVAVSLSEAWLESGNSDAVGYFIAKKPKCSSWDENGTCAEYFPDLCAFLSLNPEQGALTLTDPTSNVRVVLNGPSEPLAAGFQGRCELWVQNGSEVSPENPDAGGPGDTNSTSTSPNTSLLPSLSPLAEIFDSFPAKTARAFEAHIVEVSAVFLAGSPAQIAAEPLVRVGLPEMKKIAQTYLNIREDPLNKGAFSVMTGANLFLCVFNPEPFTKVISCSAFVLLKFGIKYEGDKLARDIVNDPPRLDYDVVEKIKPVKPIDPYDNTLFAKALAKHATHFARQNQLHSAILITFERLQGAIIANEEKYILLQSKTLLDFVNRLTDNHDALQGTLQFLSLKTESIFNAYLEETLVRYASDGLSSSERQILLNAGLTQQEIETIEKSFLDMPDKADMKMALKVGIQNEIEQSKDAQTQFQVIATTLQGVIERLEEIVSLDAE